MIIFTSDRLAAAENPHVTVVSDEHELAADTHVDTAEEHDGPGQDTPQHQEEERPLGLVVDDDAGVVVLVVVAVKDGPAGVVGAVSAVSAVSVIESYVRGILLVGPVIEVHTLHGESVDAALLVLQDLCLHYNSLNVSPSQLLLT